MRVTLMSAVAFIGILSASAAPVPKAVKAKTVEEKLLGKWKLVNTNGGVPNVSNFYVVYSKDGKMEFRYEYTNGRAPTVYQGKYKTTEPDDVNKLGTIDWTVRQGGGERGEVSKINELTESKLAFTDPQGVREDFERVKEDEKKDK